MSSSEEASQLCSEDSSGAILPNRLSCISIWSTGPCSWLIQESAYRGAFFQRIPRRCHNRLLFSFSWYSCRNICGLLMPPHHLICPLTAAFITIILQTGNSKFVITWSPGTVIPFSLTLELHITSLTLHSCFISSCPSLCGCTPSASPLPPFIWFCFSRTPEMMLLFLLHTILFFLPPSK